MYSFLIAILFVIPLTSAVIINNCYYDEKPHYDLMHKITWVCEVSSATNCISYIKDTDKIIQTNPNIQYMSLIGEVSTFNCDATCNIEFETNLLENNYTYTFGIICENSTFERQITPQLYLYEQQGFGRVIWIRNNMNYLIGGFVLLLLIVILLIILVKFALPYFK